MGRKSREKRQRKTEPEKSIKIREESGLVRFFLYVIYGATFLVLFTPLILSAEFYFPFVGPKSLYFIGLAQVLIFSFLCLVIISRKYRPRLNLLALTLILFYAIFILSSLFGVNPSYSFWSKFERMTGVLMGLHLLGFFLVLSSVFKKQADWQKIFALSILVAVIVAFCSLFGLGGSARGGATIGNTSFMATYLLFNIFLAIYSFFNLKGRWKIYPAVCFVVIAAGLFTSTARAAIISFGGGMFLLLLLFLSFKPPQRWLKTLGKILLVSSFLLALLTLLLMAKPDSFVRQKFVEEATKSRLVVWEKAWKGFQERPLFGWGPENFEFVFARYFNPCMFLGECGGEIWFDRAHNIIFDTLVTTGILGFLSYVGVFLAAFYTLWKNYLQAKINFLAASLPSVLLISYTVQNLTVFDMISSYLMFFLVLSFIAASEETKNQQEKTQGPVKRWVFGLILIVFCLAFFKFVWQPLKTDYFVIKALKAENSSQRLEFYQKALKASPLGKYQIREFFAQHSQKLVEKNFASISPEVAKKELSFVAGLLTQTKKENPLDFRSVLRLGQVYNILAFFDKEAVAKAEQTLIEAIGLSPTNQQGYWALAQNKVLQKDFKGALNLAQKAIDLEPRWLQSHQIAVKIAKIFEDRELAEELIQKAIKINPGWDKEFEEILKEQPPPV